MGSLKGKTVLSLQTLSDAAIGARYSKMCGIHQKNLFILGFTFAMIHCGLLNWKILLTSGNSAHAARKGISGLIAALFVETGGCYFGLDGVDPWDEARDARIYSGPYPVVAHPPCSRWCKLAGLVESRWGHKRGDDGGCFESALNSVREWGGVLEHPAYSKAWNKYGLIEPNQSGGWIQDLWGGAFCHVEQGNYGHPARKATWLYAVNTYLPSLRWGRSKANALVSWCANVTDKNRERERVGKKPSGKNTD